MVRHNYFSGSSPKYRMSMVFLTIAAISAWLSRAQLANGFSRVFGDGYDTTIEISILEHWFNVFRGLSHWSRTNYFFPHPQTLGYNDGYFLYGVLYSMYRGAGADPYLSAAFVHLSMQMAGFAFFYLFARQALQIRFAYALAGATVFALSNNIVIHTLHAQLLSVAFAPLCALLLFHAWRAWIGRRPVRLFAYASSFALIYGAWALTAFYMLWFFTFFTTVVLTLLAATRPKELRRLASELNLKTVLALIASFAVLGLALLPFLQVYLPKARETGMHQIVSVMNYLPAPYDLVNLGLGNYLYGDMIRYLHTTVGFPEIFSEKQMGLTPGLWLAFLAACLFLWRQRGAPTDDAAGTRTLIAAMAAATVVTCISTLDLGGITAWHWVFHYFPGARAIRVPSRYLIFLAFPVICVATYFLSQERSKNWRFVSVGVCLFLIGEQLNMARYEAIDRVASMRRLAAVKPPPPGCRAFFVEDRRPLAPGQGDADLIYRHNVEAMLIAEYFNLLTINGHSSFSPPDWGFDKPQNPEYSLHVHKYQQFHRLAGLCALDLASLEWSL